MEELNVFIDKREIDELFNEEKYKNCMDKKYFEYIVSNGKIEYIDKYLKNSKNKEIIESLVFRDKVIRVIDRLCVKLKGQRYIGELESSGIDNIEISKEIVEKYHNKILTEGVFSLIILEENIDKKYRYYVGEIEVLEDMNINLEGYKRFFSRRLKKYRDRINGYMPLESSETQNFDEINEIDLVLNTVGISTQELTFWEKILFLVRLIPLCEANYNLMELGGNGIGKTKTYSMFSPECEIVQEMSVTDLIYNRQTKEKGLLATKDVIVFDEINKIKLDGDKEKIIPQLLNFMADGQTTSPRKIISKTSLVFSGNVMGIRERIEKNEKDVFDNTHKLEDDAFLDRIHFLLPAWGLRRYSKNIHGSDISKDVFRFDYFAKVLSLLRDEDYSRILDERGYVISNGSEREVKAIRKTVSGLVKLTYPDKEIDDFTLGAYIAIAIKGRGLINKFLNNKNKNNVNKISVEVIEIMQDEKEELARIKILVNEMLKHLMQKAHVEEANASFAVYKNELFNHFGLSYNSFLNNNNYPNYYLESIRQNIGNNIFYSGKFYPNRHILVFNNKQNRGDLVFMKFALDKMGIQKNIREERLIKKIYGIDSKVFLLKNDRILMFLSEEGFDSAKHDTENITEFLYDKKELNYDELFGDDSLDENDFTGISWNSGTRNIEADLSNFYILNKDKKLKCENGDYVIPQFKYSKTVDKYSYKYFSERDKDMKKSEMMTYVEFKYFLAENGFIDLN